MKSKIDDCLFYHGNVAFVLYTDDFIMAAPTDEEMDNVNDQMTAAGLQLTLDKTLADFLGVNIHQEGDTFTLTQPKLIESILDDLCLADKNVAPRTFPWLAASCWDATRTLSSLTGVSTTTCDWQAQLP